MYGELHEGRFLDVLTENMQTFRKDFRLIKPKKFGFKAKAEVGAIEIELRPSV